MSEVSTNVSKADEWIEAFDKLAGSLDGARAGVMLALYNKSFSPEDNGRVAAHMVDALISAARAEGVQDGLEKAANMLDLKLTDFDGEWYFEEAARRVRSLTEAPNGTGVKAETGEPGGG